jgi:hypothetical protein
MEQNISWRGPPGAGKRYQLLQRLEMIATQRRIPFRVQTKLWNLDKLKEDDIDNDAEETNVASKDQIPYECSTIHYGFDVSRMSLQDRHIIRPILDRLGKGSHVLAKEKAESRILVFYHVHLLSTESCIILQSLLEQNNGDIAIWVTSEHPLPLRIAHHFTEISVGGKDRALEAIQTRIRTAGGDPNTLYDPQRLFNEAFEIWSVSARPTIKDVHMIRAFVYECLIRNIRWIECLHHSMIAILRLQIEVNKKYKAIDLLASQEGTASGQTIPSYRIPMAWESLFLQIRDAISSDLEGEVNAVAITSTTGTSGTTVQNTVIEESKSKESKSKESKSKLQVDEGAAKPGRRRVGKGAKSKSGAV